MTTNSSAALLAGKIALVTGGSSGIGAATAKTFAAQGATVAIGHHQGADRAQALLAELPGAGHRRCACRSPTMTPMRAPPRSCNPPTAGCPWRSSARRRRRGCCRPRLAATSRGPAECATIHASIDATHDPDLRSWVASANAPGCDFPIQNLPYTRFSPDGDEITLTGYCSAPGRVRIGFGECRGRISAANAAPEEKAPPSGR